MRDLIIWREVFIRRVCPAFADCLQGFFLHDWIHLHVAPLPQFLVTFPELLLSCFGVDLWHAITLLVEHVFFAALDLRPRARLRVNSPPRNQHVGVRVSALGIFVECVGAGIPASRDLLTQEFLQVRA